MNAIAFFSILFLALYAASKFQMPIDDSQDFDITEDGPVLISRSKLGTSETMVIMGGQHGSNAKWMWHEIPYELKRTKNIIIGPWQMDVKEVIKRGENVLLRQNVVPYYTSLSGFSAGGEKVAEFYGVMDFNTVLFMSPVITADELNPDFGREVVFLYGDDPMEALYTTHYTRMSKTVIDNGGIVENIELDHYDYPSYAFNKYQFQL